MSQRVDYPTIPEDVLYRVFKRFISRKDLIYSCTLVCKRWRALTFPYIFSSLMLLVKTDDELDTSGMRINRWVDELTHDPIFPSIQHIITHLTLKWGRHQGNPIGFDFIDFIPLFPALQCLTLQGTVCKRLPAAYALAKGTIKLDAVAIEGHLRTIRRHDGIEPEEERVYHEAPALCDLLSVFGDLVLLQLRKFSGQHLHFSSREPFEWHRWTSPRPRSLALEKHYQESGFFKVAPFMKHVRSLNVVAAGEDYTGSLPALITACGHLRALSIATEPLYDENPLEDDMMYFRDNTGRLMIRPAKPVYNLATLPSLKILRLYITARRNAGYMVQDCDPQGSIAVAAATVRTLAAGTASLDHIALCFRHLAPGYSSASAHGRWTLADFSALGAAHFSDLEDALLECIDAGRVGHVRFGLYGTGGYCWYPLEDHSLAALPASDCAPVVFPRLCGRKVLYLCNI